MPKRRRMTGWFNPVMLMQTAVRVAISTVFGQFADKREAMAATNAVAPQPFDNSFDYSQRRPGEDFWFDFMADTGDGWDSTFAMARLVSQPSIVTEATGTLPRGQVLMMGGDQVYPTASRAEYGDRLLLPFTEACELQAKDWPEPVPDLYAVPGNHDWYDGLNSFFGLFCRRRIRNESAISAERPGRRIAGWQTQQTRSYFAISLPGKWWLWGTDAQLAGYIDQPQVEFFRHVAKYWMEPESKLILSVGDPIWAYLDDKAPDQKFGSFSYLESIADKVDRGHQLRVVLTGDSHHYARFTEDGRHYITCGGGGAFLHPTHQLNSRKFHWNFPRPGEKPDKKSGGRDFELQADACYPSRRKSFWLTFRNFAFALLNPWFTLTYFLLYLTFNWMLDFISRMSGSGALVNALIDKKEAGDGLRLYLSLLVSSPWSFLLMLTAIGGYYYFADAPTSRLQRLGIGILHCAAQTITAVVVTWFVVGCVSRGWGDVANMTAFISEDFADWVYRKRALAALLIGTAAAAFVSATLFGVYLMTMLSLFGRHWNEAFSALRIRRFKCFLRMKIDKAGALTIHAIGLDKVPKTRRSKAPYPTLEPHLIETIVIH
jgi:hypothetical protein